MSTLFMAAAAVGMALLAANGQGPTTGLAWIAALLFGALAVFGAVLIFASKRLARRGGTTFAPASAEVEAAGEQGPGSPATGEPGLVFRRQRAYQDAFRKYRIKVDGKVVGVLPPDSALEVALPAGRHTCQARISWTGSKEVEVTVPESDKVEVLVTPAPGDPLRKAFGFTNWLTLRPQQKIEPRG